MSESKSLNQAAREAKFAAFLKDSGIDRIMADRDVSLHAVVHWWKVAFPSIPFSPAALMNYLATKGVNELDGQSMPMEALCELLRTEATAASTAQPWSEADSPKCWAVRFGFSVDTFMRRVSEGKIRVRKLSDKSYRVHSEDLPPPKRK